MLPSDGGGGSAFTPPPGDPGGIHAAASALSTHATSIGDVAQSVSRRGGLTTSSAQWQGGAQTAFTSTVTATSGVAGSLEAPLNKLVGVVRTYADALDTAQKAIARAATAYTDAQTKANQTAAAVNANPNRTQAEVDAANHTVAGYQTDMTNAEADAQKAWAVFRTARDKAVTDAAGCCTDLGKGAEGSGFTGQLENLKKVNEQFHAVWDLTPAGYVLAKKLEEAASALPGLRAGLEDAKAAQIALSSRVSALQVTKEVGLASAQDLKDLAGLTKGLDAGASELSSLASGTRNLAHFTYGAAALNGVLGVGALWSDVTTLISPEDSGVMGTVDRVAAGTNAALVTTDLSLSGAAVLFGTEATIPVAGEVLMIGTGAYLAGNYLYHHWKPFHDAANWVGNETVSVVKDAGEVVSDVGHTVSDGAKDAWHAVTSIF